LNAGSVLALHGFLGHPRAYSGIGLESGGAQVLAPLLVGHGPAPEVPSATFAAEVERLLQLASALPAPRRLLGYSQGARVGLGLLARNHELFSSAILVGVQPGYASREERALRRQVEDQWIAEIEDRGVDDFIRRFGQLPLFGPARTEARSERPYRWEHTASGLVSALLVLGTSQMQSLWPKLPEITCPVELWVGAEDAKFRAIAEEMRSELPRATVVTFDGAHHNPLTDAPAATRERLSAWLRA